MRKQFIPALFLLGLVSQLLAVTGVNPTGVNVRQSGPSTVFITFQDLDPNETATDAFWCGDVTTTGVSAINPCVANTIYGHLPARYDQSRISVAGASRNYTDIMTIPASVTRRALQAAQQGSADSNFFYVRRFSGGIAGDRFVTVTCRMGGGGARSPLALLDVHVGFESSDGKEPIFLVTHGGVLPKFGARIFYNGSGHLVGRWEIKTPADPEPSTDDLLTEATLPVERRALQQRFTLLQRFDVFLDPTGKIFLPGPDPSKLPSSSDGSYKILLRIEASADREGDSQTLAGIVNSGGVAGFPMPVLRYYVGAAEDLQKLQAEQKVERMNLMLPQEDVVLKKQSLIEFSWANVRQATLYRIEIISDQGPVVSAIVNELNYSAPPMLLDKKGVPLRWRVSALDKNGNVIATSVLRNFRLE
jgi:hypothetical protein